MPTMERGAKNFTNGQPFVVTKEDYQLPWGGRRGPGGMACGFCNRIPEVGDVWRWVYVEGRPNTFVCTLDDGPDVVERFVVRWDTVIKPILRRWGDG